MRDRERKSRRARIRARLGARCCGRRMKKCSPAPCARRWRPFSTWRIGGAASKKGNKNGLSLRLARPSALRFWVKRRAKGFALLAAAAAAAAAACRAGPGGAERMPCGRRRVPQKTRAREIVRRERVVCEKREGKRGGEHGDDPARRDLRFPSHIHHTSSHFPRHPRRAPPRPLRGAFRPPRRTPLTGAGRWSRRHLCLNREEKRRAVPEGFLRARAICPPHPPSTTFSPPMSSAEELAAELVRRAWRPQPLNYSPPQRSAAAAPARSILKKGATTRAAAAAAAAAAAMPALATPPANAAASAPSAASALQSDGNGTPTQASAGSKSVRFVVREGGAEKEGGKKARARKQPLTPTHNSRPSPPLPLFSPNSPIAGRRPCPAQGRRGDDADVPLPAYPAARGRTRRGGRAGGRR